jgi:hypothetical protein
MKRRTLGLAGVGAVWTVVALAIGMKGIDTAGVLDELSQLGVKGGSETSAAMASSPSSPITGISGMGTGAIDLVHSGSGICPGSFATCNSGSDSCECDIFKGTVSVQKLGPKSLLTLNITTDDSRSTLNGNGTCFPGTGAGTICNNAGTSCLGIFVEGSICTGTVILVSSTTGEIDFDANETFYIVKSASTGSVAGSSGGGNLQIADDLQVTSGSITSNSGYTTLSGAFQLHP